MAAAKAAACHSADKESPWLALTECQLAEHHALLRVGATGGSSLFWGALRWDQALGIVIFLSAVVFSVFSVKDIHAFILLLASHHRTASENAGSPACPKIKGSPDTGQAARSEGKPLWPISAIIALTSYRFYTGFLSATWLPYLLAMEGQYLWEENQSLFMGLAKLIYGATILMNPIFGLIGDQAIALSHGVGRRLFVRVGITVSAVGMYICILAGRDHMFLSFLSGILVWRLGEALNDVTTEALVPEMVPQSQFQVASATKACSFLFGGLFGYVLLIALADVHYSWLYYAYPIGMFICSLPALYLLDTDSPRREVSEQAGPESFTASLLQAYMSPTRYRGGFPRACLAVFVFSLGTAPMFFLLLIVRDLVGIQDQVVLQQQFSAGSIVFFLSAATASVVSAAADPGPGAGAGAPAASSPLERKGRLLVWSMLSFGLIVLVIPALCLFKDEQARNTAFYSLTVLLGAAFGAAFTLFQDLTWQLLPPGVKVANAMGFSVMSRLLGVGLGNFASGMILDLTYTGGHDGAEVYAPWGYWLMCTFSGFVVIASIVIAQSVIGVASHEELEPLSGQAIVTAA